MSHRNAAVGMWCREAGQVSAERQCTGRWAPLVVNEMERSWRTHRAPCFLRASALPLFSVSGELSTPT